MDHYTSFDTYNEFNKYESSSRINIHHLHTESGYDSLLGTSTTSTSDYNFNQNNSNDSSLFSVPTTPVKSSKNFIYNGNNCSTTPDFKQQYVADINGYYFQSIRSSYDSSPDSTSCLNSSQSQSPKSHGKSYSASIDSYVTKRDNINSKLLRSPAFKVENNLCYRQPVEQRPSVKSFSSRFAAELPKPRVAVAVKPTLTETEFMEVLISNHHLPGNPEFLIGRNMGIDNVNILGELNNRSMHNVLDKIFSYLTVSDNVRLACVSNEWRNILKSNVKLNRERVKYIKSKRHVYEVTKENHGHALYAHNYNMELVDSKRKLTKMTVDEKSEMYKVTKQDERSTNVFSALDVNCLNNFHRKRLLERQFKDFSITDETIFKMSPTKRSPVKQRYSPIKSYSPVKSSSSTLAPLICSKKSKRNLKRL